MWTNMMGWGGGWGGGPMFGLGLLWWGLLIVGIVAAARWLFAGGRAGDGKPENRALAILAERYARGEIDKAEYDARKRDLA